MKQERETVIHVEGMSCGSCIRHIDQALKELDGVSQVEVKLREGKVHVRHDDEAAPVASLMDAIGQAGYPSRAAQ